jgi:hypothetical protein
VFAPHADAEAVGRGLGSPRPRVADAAAALCGTPRGSCHKSIDAHAHHRFDGGLMVLVLCCSMQKIHDGCTIQPRPNVGFWLCPSGSAGIILAGSWVLMLCRSMVRCRCMGFSMVRCQGQSGGTYELPRSVHRARNASDCGAFVTFEDARCQMHCNALLCGCWDPHF